MDPLEYARQLHRQSENAGRAFFAWLSVESVLVRLDPDYDGWQEDTSASTGLPQTEWDAFMEFCARTYPGWQP